MKQIALPISVRVQETLDSFVHGPNQAVIDHISLFAKHPNRSPVPTYIWGENAVGKTHLLKAIAHELRKLNQPHGWINAAQDSTTARVFDPAWEVILMDDVDQFNASNQQFAFNCFVNALTPTSGLQRWVVAAGHCPPKDLKLREDLRSRLGWGHVFHLEALNEQDCRLVLQNHAKSLGLKVGLDWEDFILSRFSRDLNSLIKLLEELDAYALQTKRAVTIPLLKSMLEDD